MFKHLNHCGALMLMAQAVWIVRLAVSAVFGMAAWAKVADRAATGRALQEFGVPARLTPVLAWALPAVELIVAVAVLPSVSALVAGWAALALLAVFSVAIGVQLRRGRHPSCSCFGAASTAPIGKGTLARNAAIGVLIAAALWGSWAYAGVPEQLPADQAAILAALVVLGAVQVWQAAALRALRHQLAEARAAQPTAEGLPVGTVAPEFDLPGIDGGRSTLDSLVAAGRPVALVFLYPGCDPCERLAAELPQWRQRRNGALTLVPVGSGGLAANTAWAREHNLGDMLVQDGIEVAVRYRTRGTPTAVLIDTHGRIAAPPARGPAEIRELLSGPIPT